MIINTHCSHTEGPTWGIKKSIMAQNQAGFSSDEDTAKRKKRNYDSRRLTTGPPHAGDKRDEFRSSKKIWGVNQDALIALGFYFVEEEFMHLSFNEEKIPAELRPHLPPLTATLNLQRTSDEPSAAHQQMELLNKRLHALKPGTLLSIDGKLRFHVDEPNFPSTFAELLALRDVRFRGAGGHYHEEE